MLLKEVENLKLHLMQRPYSRSIGTKKDIRRIEAAH